MKNMYSHSNDVKNDEDKAIIEYKFSFQSKAVFFK